MWNDPDVLAALVLMWLTQAPACSGAAAATMQTAARYAQSLDLVAAVTAYRDAAARGCDDAAVAADYLAALQAARDAYRTGGDAAALAPVRATIARFEQRTAAGAGRRVELMRVVLLAAAAAAQSERDDMALFLTHALDLEGRLNAAGEGAPGVSAAEAAGDLWLQVHRFDAAAKAYATARLTVGPTLRVLLGAARAATRTNNRADACASYRAFLDVAHAGATPSSASAVAPVTTAAAAPAVAEARAYVTEQCQRP